MTFYINWGRSLAFEVLTKNAERVKNKKTSILILKNLLQKHFFDKLNEALITILIVSVVEAFHDVSQHHTV